MQLSGKKKEKRMQSVVNENRRIANCTTIQREEKKIDWIFFVLLMEENVRDIMCYSRIISYFYDKSRY